MAAPDSRTRVLVVGAGPSGLVLALSLLRNGIRPRIIDRRTDLRAGQRGAAMTSRSLEVMEMLGVKEAWRQSIPFPLVRVYKMPEGREILKEFEMISSAPGTPDRPYPNYRLLGQDHLERIIRTLLEDELGLQIEMGVELQKLEDKGNSVQVELAHSSGKSETASYEYVVGADGARSAVRTQLGLSFLGETREENFLVGDFMLQGHSADRWHMWGNFSDMFTFLRPTEVPGMFHMFSGGKMMTGHEEIISNADSLREFVKKQTGNRDDIKVGEIIAISHYRTNIKMVKSFGRGRVFISGDAAHIHSSTGGQGMNSSIQDAFNIGWKLSLVLNGFAPLSLLDTYNEERLPVIAEMLNLTTLILDKLVVKAEDGWDRNGKFNMLGVNYRFSSIVMQEEDDSKSGDSVATKIISSTYDLPPGSDVEAGDRAPDAPGLVKVGAESDEAETKLMQMFNPSKHTVLIFSDRASIGFDSNLPRIPSFAQDLVHFVVIQSTKKSVSRPAFEPSSYRILEDRDGHAYKAYKGPKDASTVYIVRPDGYVGARLATLQKAEIYFDLIFGSTAVASYSGWIGWARQLVMRAIKRWIWVS